MSKSKSKKSSEDENTEPEQLKPGQIYQLLNDQQISNIDPFWKLDDKDKMRISKKIKTSPFDENHCCLYIKNKKKKRPISSVNGFINFYINGGKWPLHRILYMNYNGPLTTNEKIRFICENKSCCNINHFQKIIHNTRSKKKSNEEYSDDESKSFDLD